MADLTPLFRFLTYPADALRALSGANQGDPIGLGDAALPGDIYKLARQAVLQKLTICDGPDGGQVVANGSLAGNPGDALSIADCHSLMGSNGQMVDILVIRRSTPDGVRLHLLPLAPLAEGQEYELIGSSTATAPERFADIASVSFLAGTRPTLAGGEQRKVEEVQVGDMLMTRDHGPQPVRWIGQQTRRALGVAAPIRILQGTLNAAHDLRLSPQHRLFIWQRSDELGTGRAEVMVKADLLVNGDTVIREEGGHVDSYQLLLDGHEIIYAEGIAVESLLVTSETRARLPSDLSLDRANSEQRDAAGFEVDEAALGDAANAADRLTWASQGRLKPKG